MAQADRRKDEHRRRVLKSGLISPEGHCTSMQCLVRDISPNGARLQIESPMGVPDAFDFYIVAENFMRPAIVRWRHGNEMGIEFLEPPAEQRKKPHKVRPRGSGKPPAPAPESLIY